MSTGRRIPPDDYLEFERTSEARHEYLLGEMVLVTGGSPNHAMISANTCIALGSRLRGSEHRVFDGSLRVCLDEKTSIYVYPDLTIVEGSIRTLEEADETITNPKVVVEVLSPATRNVTLGEKARMYTRVGSLTELLMIDQDGIALEHWVRQGEDRWDVSVLRNRADVVIMASIGCEIPVDEIYAGVESKGPRKVE